MQRGLVILVLVSLAAVARADPAHCSAMCKVDSDCGGGTVCALCFQGKCGSGCGGNCTADSNCHDPNCGYCYEGVCGNTPNHKCGGSCKVNTDCDQRGLCTVCQMGTSGAGFCTATCGMTCFSKRECLGDCNTCLGGVCTANNGTCSAKCVLDSDCNQSSDCKYCLSGHCGVGCHQHCTMDSHCLDPNCRVCSQGICQHDRHGRKCHESCVSNADCDGSGRTCALCVQGLCGSPCSSYCNQNSDCVTKGCGNCRNNQCAP
jgi:hypothetical protein